jgi:FtsP/CotA-like multicopper oxidase with cupredoxin domain
MSSNTTLQAQFSDSTLINGRMPFNCSLAARGSPCDSSKSEYSKFRVQSGKTYKMRLINSGAGSIEYFSIDNHQVTIVANDFVDIEPYNTTIVTLGTGQRSDILFTPKSNGSVWMRTQTSGKFCGGARSANPKAQAIILVDGAPDNTIPTTAAYPAPVDDGQCANDPLNYTVPAYAIPVPEPSITYNMTINQFFNATGQKLFYMNGNTFIGDYNDPILLLAQEKNYSYPYDPKWNVVNFGTNTSIRINVWNNNTSPHPMHLHGHDMYVLHAGPGQWDGVSITNPENPQRRDTQNLAPFGHIVIQYDADNPGTWPFHCHIGWHLAQGLYMTLMERPGDITSRDIPDVMAQTCRDWDAWSNRNVVDQIDSGLKKRERVVRTKL